MRACNSSILAAACTAGCNYLSMAYISLYSHSAFSDTGTEGGVCDLRRRVM